EFLSSVYVQLYSPKRPALDEAVVFLWLMAVGTMDASVDIAISVEYGASGFVDIITRSAFLFVVVASCFLIMLYKLMSLWFSDVLGLQTCLVAFYQAGTFVKVPILYVCAMAVSPSCIALILTILQIVRVPNLKVGSNLLDCAFFYDIFWVFASKWFFYVSVMIV
ncbi:Signal peptide peptidase-like 5, partial [Bienertia sinuspersici]